MRIALTGGIACGKSLVAKFLNEFGVETIDADDVAHELIPDPAERRRIAVEVFGDEAKRKELEARLHPQIKKRIDEWLEDFRRKTEDGGVSCLKSKALRLAVIPLLFETHWDADYDIICCVSSERDLQISRMMATRGYTREEAEARLEAQLPVGEKAERSHYVIENNGTSEGLKFEVAKFVNWLKKRSKEEK